MIFFFLDINYRFNIIELTTYDKQLNILLVLINDNLRLKL